nr:MAG TPA: hypothetical protein [Caudoviricetes sp.]
MVGRGRNAPTFFLTSGKRSSVPHGKLLPDLEMLKKNGIFRRQPCRVCRYIVRVL